MKEAARSETLPDRRQLIRHLRVLLQPWRWQVIAIIGLLLLTSVLEGISFSLIVPLAQAFTSNKVELGAASSLF